MDRIDSEALAAIWKELLQSVIHRETIDLSSVSYDGTNFYTFIDTFNVRCEMAKRGKNKQGRNNLRQLQRHAEAVRRGLPPEYQWLKQWHA